MQALYLIARHRRGEDRRHPQRACGPAPNARAGPPRSRSSSPARARGMPDHEALLGSIPAMSLMDSRRYLLADGVERWRDKQLDAVVAAIGELPPDLTVVLISRAKAPAKLTKAVKAAERRDPRVRGAESARDAAPAGRRRRSGSASASSRRPPGCWSTAWAPTRSASRNELERLALWAGQGGEVGRRRPRSDDRRHLRDRRLVALRRPARRRRRRPPCGSPSG